MKIIRHSPEERARLYALILADYEDARQAAGADEGKLVHGIKFEAFAPKHGVKATTAVHWRSDALRLARGQQPHNRLQSKRKKAASAGSLAPTRAIGCRQAHQRPKPQPAKVPRTLPPVPSGHVPGW